MSTGPEPGVSARSTVFPRAIAIALSGLLGLLTLDAFLRERGDFDYRLMRAIGRADFPGLDPLMRFASELTGSFWAITLWAVLIGVFLVIAAMPGIGTFSYLASRPVRSNHLLVRLAFDSAGEKLPFHLYRRIGLKRLVAGRGQPAGPAPHETAVGGGSL